MRKMDTRDVCISSVTYAEPVCGAEKSEAANKNRLALSLLLANMEILDFDTRAADEFGKVRADPEKRGIPIDPSDMLIAGHAKSLGYTVVTNNAREFCRVKKPEDGKPGGINQMTRHSLRACCNAWGCDGWLNL